MTGAVIAPGFIDMHSHADFTLPAYPGATNSLTQGVTTEVVGNCGWSPAPLATDGRAHAYRDLAVGIGRDLDWEWTGYGSYLAALQHARPAVNCVPLVGHHAVRTATMGAEARPPSAGELDRMRVLVRDAMLEGAFGLSTGLVYPPGAYVATDELVELHGDMGVGLSRAMSRTRVPTSSPRSRRHSTLPRRRVSPSRCRT